MPTSLVTPSGALRSARGFSGPVPSGNVPSGSVPSDTACPDSAASATIRDFAGPMPRLRPPQVECGNLPFVIKRDGTWLYRGSPINRKGLVCLFASVLKRETDGSYWLETPAERGRIEVEDAPFTAIELDWTDDGRDQVLSFRTNVDEVITAGPDHPIRVVHNLLTCEPTPYIHVRAGRGEHAIEARICRAVYYELVALAVPEWVGCKLMAGVWSCNRFFPIGELPRCGK